MAELTSTSNLFTLFSFNMWGKNQGSPFLTHICNTLVPDIIFLQEHWQTPTNLNSILNFSSVYLGYEISAMERAVEKSVLKGRPYGGTATLIHNKWRAFIKIIATVERYVIIALSNLLLINIYLLNNCSSVFNEVKAIFEEISVYLDQYSNFTTIWRGDFIVDLHLPSRMSNYINMFMTKYSIDLSEIGRASCRERV